VGPVVGLIELRRRPDLEPDVIEDGEWSSPPASRSRLHAASLPPPPSRLRPPAAGLPTRYEGATKASVSMCTPSSTAACSGARP
jgi:hypothetical protein